MQKKNIQKYIKIYKNIQKIQKYTKKYTNWQSTENRAWEAHAPTGSPQKIVHLIRWKGFFKQHLGLRFEFSIFRLIRGKGKKLPWPTPLQPPKVNVERRSHALLEFSVHLLDSELATLNLGARGKWGYDTRGKLRYKPSKRERLLGSSVA